MTRTARPSSREAGHPGILRPNTAVLTIPPEDGGRTRPTSELPSQCIDRVSSFDVWKVSADRRLACGIGAWTGRSESFVRAWLSRGAPFGKRCCSRRVVGRNRDRYHRCGEVFAGDGPIDYRAGRRNSCCTTVELVLQSRCDSRTGTGGLRVDEDVYRDEKGGHRLGLRAG